MQKVLFIEYIMKNWCILYTADYKRQWKSIDLYCLFTAPSQQASAESLSSMFSWLKKQTGRLFKRNNKSDMRVAVHSHARQSDGVVLSADAGNGDLSPGKKAPPNLLSSLLSVCYCLYLTGQEHADSLRKLCNIPRNRLRCVQGQANVIWLTLFSQHVDLIGWFSLPTWRLLWFRFRFRVKLSKLTSLYVIQI